MKILESVFLQYRLVYQRARAKSLWGEDEQKASKTLLLTESGPQISPWETVYTMFAVRFPLFQAIRRLCGTEIDVWLIRMA